MFVNVQIWPTQGWAEPRRGTPALRPNRYLSFPRIRGWRSLRRYKRGQPVFLAQSGELTPKPGHLRVVPTVDIQRLAPCRVSQRIDVPGLAGPPVGPQL